MDKNLQKNADRGWGLMSQKLDREMPQTGRRRGLGWLWPFAAAGLVLMGAGLFLMNKNGGKTVAPGMAGMPVFEENKMADVQNMTAQSVDNQSVESNSVGNEVEKNTPNFEKKQPIGEAAGADFSSKNLTQKTDGQTGFSTKKTIENGPGRGAKFPQNPATKTVGQTEISTKRVEWISEQKPILMAEKPVETAVVFSEKPIEIQPVFSEEGAAEIRVSKKITPFGKLPGLGFSPIFLDKKTPPTAEKLIKPIAAKGTKKWQFGVGAGMQTIGFQRFNGHATGFLAERKLAARTRLTAGLGWSRTVLASNPVSSSNLFVLVNHSDYLSATNDLTLNFTAPEKSVAEYDPMTNSYSNIQLAISANVLHRLEMPLILTHKIGSRWYFGAGFSGSWQFMARSVIGAKSLEYEKAGSYENFNSAAPAAPTSDISSSRQVNKLLTRKLPNFDIAAVGFAGLDLSKKWCATAQFQQGLLNQTALPGLDKQLYSARVSIIRWF